MVGFPAVGGDGHRVVEVAGMGAPWTAMIDAERACAILMPMPQLRRKAMNWHGFVIPRVQVENDTSYLKWPMSYSVEHSS